MRNLVVGSGKFLTGLTLAGDGEIFPFSMQWPRYSIIELNFNFALQNLGFFPPKRLLLLLPRQVSISQ